jgi:hypothetical protein
MSLPVRPSATDDWPGSGMGHDPGRASCGRDGARRVVRHYAQTRDCAPTRESSERKHAAQRARSSALTQRSTDQERFAVHTRAKSAAQARPPSAAGA